MNSVFSEQILADKLSKLNSTQQCIETLSHWCIFHRQKAEQVVQTWDKQFHSSEKEQKIPFLYLANDILQNSRRKGTEFVGEFWKVLPAALKDVLENGDEHGKNVVSRLDLFAEKFEVFIYHCARICLQVGIWEERKVFGSRARDLNDLMLGNEPLPTLEFNKKRSRPIRILRRDSRSIKIKLSIGGTAEKIVSALHTVLSEHPNEDTDLKKCKDAVHRVGKMEKNVVAACSQAGDADDRQRATLANELQEEESSLKQCVEKLKSIETSRAMLVSQMKEALREQESELENIRTQLQVAQAQIEVAANMRRRLNNEPIIPLSNPPSNSPSQTSSKAPANETSSKRTAASIAAEVADRLAASTHSQQIMTSVLSSFAAQEAKNAVLSSSTAPNTNSETTQEKRLKRDKPTPVSDTTFVAAQPVTVTATQQYQTMIIPQPSMRSQASTQPQYNLYQASPQQYFQPTGGGGGVMIGLPYSYSTIPPPPPQMMSLARPRQLAPQQQQQPMGLIQQPPLPAPMTLQQPMPLNQQPVPLNLQQPVPPSYRPLQPLGMAFYHHQSQ